MSVPALGYSMLPYQGATEKNDHLHFLYGSHVSVVLLLRIATTEA